MKRIGHSGPHNRPHGAALMVTCGAPSPSSNAHRPLLRQARRGTDHAASPVHFGLIHSLKSRSRVNRRPKWAFLLKRPTCDLLPAAMASPLPPQESTDSIIFFIIESLQKLQGDSLPQYFLQVLRYPPRWPPAPCMHRVRASRRESLREQNCSLY